MFMESENMLDLNAPVLGLSADYLAENEGPSVLATVGAMMILCTAFVFLHYFSRYLSGTTFGLEDGLFPFGWLANMTLCVTDICESTTPFLVRKVRSFSICYVFCLLELRTRQCRL